MLLAASIVIATACGGGSDAENNATPIPTLQIEPGSTLGITEAVELASDHPDAIRNQSIELETFINAVPARIEAPGAPPAGCPVFPDRLSTLTEHPFMTELPVAGVMLPNAVPASLPSLRLVIPLSLGIVDPPDHASLRGHLLDPDYAQCPEAERLFILEEIVRELPTETPHQDLPATSPAEDWNQWSDVAVALKLDYPVDWTVQETRNVGAIVEVAMTDPDDQSVVRLKVTAGETYWNPNSGSPPPAPLSGSRRLSILVGGAAAQMTDTVGEVLETGSRRELRAVLNYNGNTVTLTTHFIDGLTPDIALLNTFTDMLGSFVYDKPVTISDPLDPRPTASTELGDGPFIDESAARDAAAAESGLAQPEVLEARLVAEREAREATPGACQNFQERPEGVWLVRVQGTMPTGQTGLRLVYLDAVRATALCLAAING